MNQKCKQNHTMEVWIKEVMNLWTPYNIIFNYTHNTTNTQNCKSKTTASYESNVTNLLCTRPTYYDVMINTDLVCKTIIHLHTKINPTTPSTRSTAISIVTSKPYSQISIITFTWTRRQWGQFSLIFFQNC